MNGLSLGPCSAANERDGELEDVRQTASTTSPQVCCSMCSHATCHAPACSLHRPAGARTTCGAASRWSVADMTTFGMCRPTAGNISIIPSAAINSLCRDTAAGYQPSVSPHASANPRPSARPPYSDSTHASTNPRPSASPCPSANASYPVHPRSQCCAARGKYAICIWHDERP